MDFEIAYPAAFFLLLPAIPALIISFAWSKKISISFKNLYGARAQSATFGRHLRFRLAVRSVLWFFAWISLVCAFSGISWGVEAVPVEKTGKAVSFVFDISYSMTARDVQAMSNSGEAGGSVSSGQNITRLEAASSYALQLLTCLSDTAVSTVIVKGDGIITVPLTEDIHSIEAFIPLLSPELMTSAGSRLDRGIDAAVRSFPATQNRSSSIIVFTDGGDTGNNLEESVKNAVTYGVSVVFIGFGSEKGTAVTAGDGKTSVETALQSQKLKTVADNVIKKTGMGHKYTGKYRVPVQYIDASQKGSAVKVIQTILDTKYVHGKSSVSANSPDDSISTGYEMKIVPRYRFFIIIALFLFVVGFSIIEIRLTLPWIKNSGSHRKAEKNIFTSFFLLFLVAMFFSGCTMRTKQAAGIIEGQFYWYQKKYPKAVSAFLETLDGTEDNTSVYNDYALLGLASSYIMQNETNAAIEKLNKINPNSSSDILFEVYYNKGIIAWQNGSYNEAAECFKQALLIDSSSIDAKVNLELSVEQDKEASNVEQGIQEMIPASQKDISDSNILENTLFSIIRENDKNRWKNQKAENEESSADDY